MTAVGFLLVSACTPIVQNPSARCSLALALAVRCDRHPRIADDSSPHEHGQITDSLQPSSASSSREREARCILYLGGWPLRDPRAIRAEHSCSTSTSAGICSCQTRSPPFIAGGICSNSGALRARADARGTAAPNCSEPIPSPHCLRLSSPPTPPFFFTVRGSGGGVCRRRPAARNPPPGPPSRPVAVAIGRQWIFVDFCC